jgi:hypothetical protein
MIGDKYGEWTEVHKYHGFLLSYGAGVNTCAMLLRLVSEGWRGPIVFADTGGEHPETYCHMKVMDEWLAPHGLTIERVSFGTLTPEEVRDAARRASIGLGKVATTLEGYCLTLHMVPILGIRWCSIIFKRSVIAAWAATRGLMVQMIGIASDEPNRIRDDAGLVYPLNDWGWTRRDCVEYIRKRHVPVPRKSGCFFCPAQKRSEWRELLEVHPDLYARAEAMEVNASRNGHRATFSPDGKYSLADLRQGFETQGAAMFEDQEVARVYEPCICGI